MTLLARTEAPVAPTSVALRICHRIAERAGVSIGTLCQFFRNKDALLVALCQRHVADAAARLTPVVLRNALLEAEKVLVSELGRYLARSPEVRASDLRLAAHFVVRTIDATAQPPTRELFRWMLSPR